MKTVFIVTTILIVAFVVLLFNSRSISKAGEAAGLVEGMLSKCPDKPNCVCSEHKDDPDHYIEPIIMPQNITVDPLTVLKNVIQDMGGHLQIAGDNYLAATFTSAIFKFVDDLEIRIDPAQKAIHIRSASRVGYSDLGVNRKRTKLLKKLYNQRVSAADKSSRLPPGPAAAGRKP